MTELEEWKQAAKAEAYERRRAHGMIRELLAILEYFAYPGPFTGRPTDEELQDRARAIIAKAKGEA